jgi:cytochrome c peroxidase
MKLRAKIFAFLSDGRGRLFLVAGMAAIGFAIIAVSTHPWAPEGVQAADFATSQTGDSGEPIQPIAVIRGLNPAKIQLGRKLFNDPLLSHNNQVSCSSCHHLKAGGSDRVAHSIGIGGAEGAINAPTVFNSGFNLSQDWDGRAATLESQIDGPVQSAVEMGSTWPEVIRKLNMSPDYVRAFRGLFRDSGDIRRDNIENSIAEFERSLATPDSRFDRYLRHDAGALTSEELDGYRLFKSFGCSSCHQGANVGGNMYQKLGVMTPYFKDPAQVTRSDRGRFNVTGDPADMYMFKVPSLRNVELTAPYLHDGSAATLADAVRKMATYQLGRALTDKDTEAIVGFLKTLTGQWNGQSL